MLKLLVIFEELDKLGQGFTTANPLEEVYIGTLVNQSLNVDYKFESIALLNTDKNKIVPLETIKRCLY